MTRLVEELPRNLERLCAASIKDFCDGYHLMFEISIRRRNVSAEIVNMKDLQDDVADAEVCGVFVVDYVDLGGDKGSFHILLEHEALFILGGLTVMQPIPRVKEYLARGNESDALLLKDAVEEVGNLLKGSFEKCFRGEGEDESERESITMQLRRPILLGDIELPDLDGAEKVHQFSYKLTISGLDPFVLKIVFPVQ